MNARALFRDSAAPVRPLWYEPAPEHWDDSIAWWLKALLVAALTLLAYFFLDARIARWALAAHPIPDLADPLARHNDIARELMMLEQWGQWTCSVIVIAAVACLDKAGLRRAAAIAWACLATVAVTYLIKDLCGRSRPYAWHGIPGLSPGQWVWGGPRRGFTGGARWTSFPSAHTTGAFALSASLAWFYPKGRWLFMTLAVITATQRVLHSAHFVSDVIAGMGIAVFISRATLRANVAGRLLRR